VVFLYINHSLRAPSLILVVFLYRSFRFRTTSKLTFSFEFKWVQVWWSPHLQRQRTRFNTSNKVHCKHQSLSIGSDC